MFKKALCWLLIIQHLNVYVLQAAPGDMKVAFGQDDLSPSRRLTLLRETEVLGQDKEIFHGLFEIKGREKAYFRPIKIDFPLQENIDVEMDLSQESLHIHSNLIGHAFSLDLSADGFIQVHHMDMLKGLAIETLGEIHILNDIKAARLSLAGQDILNEAVIKVDEQLSLRSTGKIRNYGEIGAKRASFKGEDLEHHGTLKAHEEATLTFKTIVTSPSSHLTAKNTFSLTGENLTLEGHLSAGQHLHLEGDRLSSTGEIQSTTLTAALKQTFVNEGSFHGLKTVRLDASSLENKGDLSSGEDCFLTAALLTNLGNLEAERKLSLALGEKGVNHGTLTAKVLNIKGGTFENLSAENIKAEEANIELQKLKNEGGLLADTTTLTVGELENLGTLGATTMTIDVAQRLRNAKKGLIFASHTMGLTGNGLLENEEEGEIKSEGSLSFRLPEIDNKGSLLAGHHMILENLSKELRNLGLILSEGRIKIASSAKIFNGGLAGIIEARKGPLEITASEMVNQGLMNALEGHLILDVERGENHTTLYGHEGLTLTIRDGFTNYKSAEVIDLGLLKSPGPITIKGPGTLTNKGFMTSDKDIEVETDLENHGRIHTGRRFASLTQGKHVINEADGLILAEQEIRLGALQQLANQGHILSLGTLSLEDTVLFQNHGQAQGHKAVNMRARTLHNFGSILSTEDVLQVACHTGFNDKAGLIKGKHGTSFKVGKDQKLTLAELSGDWKKFGLLKTNSLEVQEGQPLTVTCSFEEVTEPTHISFLNSAQSDYYEGGVTVQPGQRSVTFTSIVPRGDTYTWLVCRHPAFNNQDELPFGLKLNRLTIDIEEASKAQTFKQTDFLQDWKEHGLLKTPLLEVQDGEQLTVTCAFEEVTEPTVISFLNSAQNDYYEGGITVQPGQTSVTFTSIVPRGDTHTWLVCRNPAFNNRDALPLGLRLNKLRIDHEEAPKAQEFKPTEFLQDWKGLGLLKTPLLEVQDGEQLTVTCEFEEVTEPTVISFLNSAQNDYYEGGVTIQPGQRSVTFTSVVPRGDTHTWLVCRNPAFNNKDALSLGVQLKQVTLKRESGFTNDGDILSEGVVGVSGSGALTNNGLLQGPEETSLRISSLINTGEISSAKAIRFSKINKKFKNTATGKIISEGTLTVKETPTFENEGIVQARTLLEMSLFGLQNQGSLLASEGGMNLTCVEGTNLGLITTPERLNLTFTGLTTPFRNTGTLLGESGITASFYAFDNKGTVSASQGPLTLKAAIGQNTGTGKIYGNSLTIGVGERFENEGLLLADHSFIAQGAGKLINRKQMRSHGTLTLGTHSFTNEDHVQAEEIAFTGKMTVDNTPTAKILSKTHMQSEAEVELNNLGLISSEGDLTFAHSHYDHKGRLEVQGNILFPHCHTFVNPEGSALISTAGQIHFPQVHSFLNEGVFLSQGDLSLSNLTAFTNRGMLSSGGILGLSTTLDLINQGRFAGALGVKVTVPRNFSNQGRMASSAGPVHIHASCLQNTQGSPIWGQQDVSLTATSSFNNLGDILSPGTVAVYALYMENAHKIAADQGITLTGLYGAKSQGIVHKEGASLESSQGMVALNAQTLAIPGIIRGHDVSLTSEREAFTENAEAVGTLFLNSPQGWIVKEGPRERSHNVNLKGPIHNPSCFPLHIKGNFAWRSPDSIPTGFDMIIGGHLTLRSPGDWTNYAKVRADQGASISLRHFTNEGAFYGGRDTSFICQGNFDNCPGRSFLVRGNVLLHAPGSWTNHPGATFKQEEGDKTITFEVGKEIKNIGGCVYLEGTLRAASPLFTNKLEAPILVSRTNSYDFLYGGLLFSSLVHHFTRDAIREYAPSHPATFYARAAHINGELFQNLGGSFSAGYFEFNGTHLKNLTISYKDRGEAIFKSWDRGMSPEVAASSCSPYKCVYYGEGHAYVEVPFDNEVGTTIATLYSPNELRINAKIQNTGDQRTRILTLSSPEISFPLTTITTPPHTPIPPVVTFDSYVEAQTLTGPSFWIRASDKQIALQWLPDLPLRVMPEDRLKRELTEKSYAQQKREEAEIASFKAWITEDLRQQWQREDRAAGSTRYLPLAPIRGKTQAQELAEKRTQDLTLLLQQVDSPLFWEMNPQDLKFVKSFITPRSLYESPPLMAVIVHPLLKGNERVRWHPVLAAELLTKCLMHQLGVAKFSRTICTPELLLRVLEIEAYIQARQLHRKPVLPAPPNWGELTPEQQTIQRQVERITWPEIEQFRDPGVVFELKESLGEPTLSAAVTFPKHLRKAFESVVGRAVAQYLNAISLQGDNQSSSPIVARGGIILQSAHHTTTGDMYSQGNITTFTKGHHHAPGHTVSQHGDVAFTATHLTHTGYTEGENVTLQGEIVRHVTPQERLHLLHEACLNPFHSGALPEPEKATAKARSGDARLMGKKALEILGAKVESARNTEMEAAVINLGAQIDVLEVTTENSYLYSQKSSKSDVKTGGDFLAHATQHMRVGGIDSHSGGRTHLKSDGTFEEEPAYDITKSHAVHKEKSFWGSSEETHTTAFSTPHFTTQTSDKDLKWESQGNMDLKGAPRLESGEKLKVHSHQGKLRIKAPQSFNFSHTQSKESDLIWQSQEDTGFSHTQHLLPSFVSKKGGVSFSGTGGIELDVKSPDPLLIRGVGLTLGLSSPSQGNLSPLLDQLEKNPETAWIKELRKTPTVKWNLVSDVFERWDYKSQGLTPGAASLVALGVTIATGGWAASLASVLGLKGTAATMAVVGFSTFASQTAIFLLGNRFDVGKTLADLSRPENLRALGLSIATAGLTQGLSNQLGVSLKGPQVVDYVSRSAVQTGISTGVQMITGDLSPKDALQQGVVNVVANSVGGYAANRIGQMYQPTPILQDGKLVTPAPSLNWFEHKILHALLGTGLGIASNLKNPGQGAVGGAIGGALGETLMEAMAPSLQALHAKAAKGTLTQRDLLNFKAELNRASDFARLGSAFTTFVLKQEVNASALASTNAIENNFIPAALAAAPLALATAKISWEIYALTHAEELEATKQEICKYVADKLGYEPKFVEAIYDAGMLVGSTGNAVRKGYRGILKLAQKKVTYISTSSNNNSSSSASNGVEGSRVRPINGRMPINADYANKVYPLEKLPKELRDKYPHSVPFTGTGHPDFSRYAIKKVQIKVTGDRFVDEQLANKAAGFSKKPEGYTWHHHHDGQTMMLVDKELHKSIRHTGSVAQIKGN